MNILSRDTDVARSDFRRPASIVLACLQSILLFTLTTLPTPLYQSYSQRFHFSVLILTLIYATYVAGTLGTLFFLGRLSDQLGRKPIALAGIGGAIVAAIVFALASNTAMLFVARFITGIAAGVASPTGIAWIHDLYGKAQSHTASTTAVSINLFGLGFGPLLCGWLAIVNAWVLPYVVYLVLIVPLGLFLLRAKETKEDTRAVEDVSLNPRIGVPGDLRTKFLAPGLIAFVIFSLVGFYSAVAGGLMSNTLHLKSHGIAGTIVFELFAVSAVCTVLFQNVKSRAAMLGGATVMLPTLALLVLAQALASVAALIAGTAIGGVALGLAYRGSLEVSNAIAPDDKRAELVSALFVCGNLGLAIPVIGIGIVSGLATPALANYIFAGIVALLAIAGVTFELARKQTA